MGSIGDHSADAGIRNYLYDVALPRAEVVRQNLPKLF